jgi:hypothetical protein
MRPVLFVKYYDKGSTVIAGEQLSEVLRARGVESRTVYAHELAGVSDSILIFIKTSKLPHLWRARRRRNTLILDLHDTLVFKRHVKNRRFFHGLIFRNRMQLEDYGRRGPGAVLIYHHWDPRYRPNEVGDAAFKVGYLGEERSFELWGQLPGVRCYGLDRMHEGARHLNCHLSIRAAPREMRYKPTMKVVTAAACDAVLITTRDSAALDLLGPDYPYYTDPGRDSVLRAIDHARKTFGTALWRSALDTMRRIKPAHTIDAEIHQYLEYLRRFG